MRLDKLENNIKYSQILEYASMRDLFNTYTEYIDIIDIKLKNNIYQIYSIKSDITEPEEEYLYLGVKRISEKTLCNVFIGIDLKLKSIFNYYEFTIDERLNIQRVNIPIELIDSYYKIFCNCWKSFATLINDEIPF
jgi:hypothetical protein